jgi:membrane protease YdiL (CAAX protease family)
MARRVKEASDDLTGWATLLVGILCAAGMLWKNILYPRYFRGDGMDFAEFNLWNIVILLLPPLCLLLVFLKRDLSEFGMRPCSTEGMAVGWVGGLLFLPVLWVVGRTPQFQNYYIPWLAGSRAYYFGKIDWGRLAYHEAVMALYMFAWEWFFRGFLTFGLKKIMPAWAAALIQAALFCLLHWGKPPIELISSFFGGLLLAGVAIRYRSMLPCFLVHFLISMANDGGALYFHFNPARR